jgi:signal transduction histidine kinase
MRNDLFPGRFGLSILTRFIATQRVYVATAAIVVVVIAASGVLSCLLWLAMTGAVPSPLLVIIFVVSVVVATPIALYLVSIIHEMAISSSELVELSNKLREAHDRTTEASAAKSRFLASTSHELRTPLNAILGFSEIVKNQTFGPCGVARYVEYADHIHESGQKLLRLINSVLDLSKIESGREHIDLTASVDVSAAISNCCQTLRVLADKAQVLLVAKDMTAWAGITGNDDLIRQILDNLVANAIKFTLPGGTITVGSEIDHFGNLIVHVADTGIGMTPEEMQVAIDVFGQIDSKHSRKHHGTGLGLPLVKAMVELHGGKLTLQSVPGAGTTVFFSIPASRVRGKMEEANVSVGYPNRPIHHAIAQS